ncbi:MAG: polymer-forming cytoskeletal protein [Bdellovibrionota bacterium]
MPPSTPSAGPGLNAILDQGTQYEGKLIFEGAVLINGKFDGEISSKDHLIIGEQGKVSADIDVGSIQISGEVTGTIRASQRVELLPTARLRGELQVPPHALRIEQGAVFEGTCKMQAPAAGAGASAPRPSEAGKPKSA